MKTVLTVDRLVAGSNLPIKWEIAIKIRTSGGHLSLDKSLTSNHMILETSIKTMLGISMEVTTIKEINLLNNHIPLLSNSSSLIHIK
jgi:hypothetical protein